LLGCGLLSNEDKILLFGCSRDGYLACQVKHRIP
jgi:hypothetical protein